VDRAFYVGLSRPQDDWPYVLPGPPDHWAGSHSNARTQWDQMNTLPIGFVLERAGFAGSCQLTIGIRDSSPKAPPRLRIAVNGVKSASRCPARIRREHSK
jgi:hypothetical protein